jgi:transposase InsO family protein
VYAAYPYQGFLRARGIVPSMNRPHGCQDNAHMESFFHSLKAELVHQYVFSSDAQLNGRLGYIEHFYNTKRMHSSLGYHSPVEFETLGQCLAKCPPNRMKIPGEKQLASVDHLARLRGGER